MFGKLKRFLCFLDDLAEVLVFHVLFSKRNWKKTAAALLLLGLAISQGAWIRENTTALVTPADTYATRGYESLLKGKNQDAIANLEAAVTREPGRALYQQRLGLAYLESGQNERALAALQAAYRIAPSRTTLFYLGCVYQNLKLNEVAIGLFNQVRSSGAQEASLSESALGYEPVAEAKIGECYIKKGELDRAIDSLNRTIAMYPNYPHSYFYLGVAHWEKGNPDLGVEQFFKVIELYPQESAAYYNVACYYSIKGIPDLALVWLEKAFKAGFSQFKHMKSDSDLDNIRQLPKYKSLFATYSKLIPHDE
jgi:tetratricopeptide (TPR) repeat protein